jgi:hypothetical protein
MININDAWDNFCDGEYDMTQNISINENKLDDKPKCSDLYISTKTKISYLNKLINLKKVFWDLPVIEYHLEKEGIIKKQMKLVSDNEEDLEEIKQNILDNKRKYKTYTDEIIITNIVNPNGRIKFKDIRKINIGLSKKDIISYKCKKKGAFYNCFVVIIRKKYKGIYREIHIKVFNTGKLEIPGIKNDELLECALNLLIDIISLIDNNKDLKYLKEKNETVLINSNFTCGFYINRNKLYQLLKYKYKINSGYDSCSYPGIQCEFYYNDTLNIQTGIKFNKTQKKVSFMIFRTGSVLIVGKTTEKIIFLIYEFIKKILLDEYDNIFEKNIIKEKIKSNKKRKKVLIIEG